MRIDKRSRKRQKLNRREVFKALGALGGATTASALLPEEWIKRWWRPE